MGFIDQINSQIQGPGIMNMDSQGVRLGLTKKVTCSADLKEDVRHMWLAGEVLQEEGAAHEKALDQKHVKENKEEQLRPVPLPWSRK